MKRTVTVNISGIAFIIDDDAYGILKAYLEEVGRRINENNEDKETLADVESRIAELLRENGADHIRVVDTNLVHRIISTIGSPEVFGPARNNAGDTAPGWEKPVPRKLMRDGQDKIIGGVCSGIAAYTGVDTTIIRVIAFLLIFLGGLTVIAYIVLWIVVPMAKTPGEIAMMNEMKASQH